MGGRALMPEVSRINVTGRSFIEDVNEQIPSVLLLMFMSRKSDMPNGLQVQSHSVNNSSCCSCFFFNKTGGFLFSGA